MIEPQSKLPWESSIGLFGAINSSDENQEECVCMDILDEDNEYIVLCANNFPKSIELLKEVFQMGDMIEKDRIKFEDKISEFLKEIENE